MSEAASKIHVVLDTLIARAVIEGKELSAELLIPLSSLSKLKGDQQYENVDATSGIMLRVKIETTWDTSNEMIPLELLTGEDDEPDDGETSDKDKGSH